MLKYVRLYNEEELPEIGSIKPFKAIVIIEDEVSDEWQALTSEWLVDSGCLYMMAWGRDCSSWNDSVDFANLEQGKFEDIPDDAFVMTTWHESEPIGDVFFFAKHAAYHPTIDLENILILHVGRNDKEAEFKSIFLDA